MTRNHGAVTDRIDAVERLLRGDDIDTVSRETGFPRASLVEWSDAFLEAGRARLGSSAGESLRPAPRSPAAEAHPPDEDLVDQCLRLAREAADLGIFDCDTVLNVYHWDGRMRAFWGFSATDPIEYDPVMAAIHPEDREAVVANWDRALDPGGSGRFVAEYRVFDCADGSMRWIAATGKAIFVDGRAVRLLGTAQDITGRKRVEEILKRTAEADAFRLALADGLRPLADPVTIQAVAAQILGEHLRASRVHYAEVDETGADARVDADYCSGVPSVVGRYHLDDYGPTVMAEFRAGRTLIIEDVANDPRLSAGERAATAALQIGAYVIVPLIKEGVPKAFLVVHQDVPRSWSVDDLQLIEETAERTWAAVERAQAEAGFRRSEHNLSAIIEALPVGVAVANESGTMLSANPEGLRIHGLESPAELLERCEDYDGAFAAFYPDGRPMPIDEWPWARAIRGEFVKDYEVCLRLRNGEERIVNFSLIPMLGDTPEDRLIVFMLQDITESRRIRETLERNLAQSQAVFQYMAEGLIVMDCDGHMIDANPAALAIHGVASIEEMPQSVDMVLSSFEPFDLEGNPLAREDWPVSRVLRGENFSNYEIHVRSRHLDHEWIGSYGGTPVYDAKGEMRLAIFTVRDVTAQHEAEAALREADRRKDVFLATLAHELRNPLAPISGAVGALKAGNPERSQLPALDIIERQLQQLVRLVDDLLDVSRISRGKVELRRERIPISGILEQALESSLPHLQAARHALTVALPDEPLEIDGDPLRLAQVFLNLLNNAAKYTRPGGRVHLSAARDGSDVVVRVADSGLGIAREDLPHIFGMFVQPSRIAGRQQEGLGIGLSVARSLVEMHGGSIEARSDGVDQGSEFVVRLPLAGPSTPAPAPPEPVAPRARRIARRILIADDNRDVGQALAMFLGISRHLVEVAHDGLQAIEVAARFQPDVVLLDIGMPGIDGYETCRRMRAEPWGRDLVILAFTGWGQDEDQRRTAEAGFDLHIVKPIAPQKLLALIDDLDSVRASRA